MKINVNQVLKNYNGKPIYEARIRRDDKGRIVRDEDNNVVTEDKALTLKEVITNALLSSEENKPRSSEDKNKAHQINLKVWEAKESEVDLTVKQRGYIIERVGIFYNPLVLGRVEELLEGKN